MSNRPNSAKQGENYTRVITLDRAAIQEESRTVELAFATETPVERWDCMEILDCSTPSVRLNRLTSGGPLLMDHNTRDQIGVIDAVTIGSDRIARATVRFSKSARASEIWQDVLDGIRTCVSVGYMVHAARLESTADGVDTYRVTDWEPYEVSLVATPADIACGVGRECTTVTVTIETETEDAEEPETEEPEENACKPNKEHTEMTEEIRTATEAATTAERQRVADITRLCADHGAADLTATLIADGTDASSAALRILDAKKQNRGGMITPQPETSQRITVSAGHYNPQSLKAWSRHGAAAERQAYEAGQWARAIVFNDAAARRWCTDNHLDLRVMSEGVGSAGGYLVPDALESAVIDLRVQYGAARRLCRMVPMGSAAVTIPKRVSGVTAYFTAEGDATTASDMAWGQIELVAKELSALTRISMSLSEDAVIDLAAWVADEQAYAFAAKEDACLINGDGTSTYGGMTGIIPQFEAAYSTLKGVYAGATNTDTFGEFTAAEVTAWMAKLPSYARTGANFLFSPEGDAALLGRLQAAGGGNTIQTLAGGIMGATFLGYGRQLCEAMPTSATDFTNKVAGLFGNFSQGVAFGDRRGITVQVLRERYAEYRQIGIIGTERIDINAHGIGDTSAAGPIVALVGA